MDLKQEALVNFMKKHDEGIALYLEQLFEDGEVSTISEAVDRIEQATKLLLAFQVGFYAA